MRDETRCFSDDDRKFIRSYVKKVIRKELQTIREYYDVDKGLHLRKEVVKRLTANRQGRCLSHEEFWQKALKSE